MQVIALRQSSGYCYDQNSLCSNRDKSLEKVAVAQRSLGEWDSLLNSSDDTPPLPKKENGKDQTPPKVIHPKKAKQQDRPTVTISTINPIKLLEQELD